MRRIAYTWILIVGMAIFPIASAGQPELDPDTRQKVEAFENIVDSITEWSFSRNTDEHASRGERLNNAFVALTGEAINPLFGVAVLGIYNYWRTDAEYREYLPVYYRPEVWIPLLVIMALMLFNSTIGEAAPFLKTPLNALGDVVNKAGAIIVLPLIVKMFADTVAEPLQGQIAALSNTLFPAAVAAESALSASVLLAAAGWVAGAIIGVIIYLAVWLTFNMVDVLILLCPFPGIDALLKSFRLAMAGTLIAMREVSPVLAFALALVVVVISFFMAGWSFRLSVFGWITSTDLLFLRRKPVDAEPVLAFSCEAARLPMRTLGRLEQTPDGTLTFSYRPWLVRPRRTLALGNGAQFAAGRGLLNPFLIDDSRPDLPWLRLPPRYHGQETRMVGHFHLTRVVDCGVARAFGSWLGALFRRTPTEAE